MAEKVFACTRDEKERIALSNHTRRYRTWTHAAYAKGYDGTTPTLCGKRFYDPSPEARGAGAWAGVSCKACKKAIAKLEREGAS